MNYSNFIDNDNGDLLEEYSEYIDRINDAAYKDVYMLSNPSLSKNPYSGSTLLSNLIQKKSIRSSKRLFIRSILAFYAKNIFYLIIWVIQFSYVKLFARGENKMEINNNIVFIDTFFEEPTAVSARMVRSFFQGQAPPTPPTSIFPLHFLTPLHNLAPVNLPVSGLS